MNAMTMQLYILSRVMKAARTMDNRLRAYKRKQLRLASNEDLARLINEYELVRTNLKICGHDPVRLHYLEIDAARLEHEIEYALTTKK